MTHLGHKPGKIPHCGELPIGYAVAPARTADALRSIETPRVCRAAWRCGGMAARGARAAARTNATHWRPQRWQQPGRSGRPGAPRGIPTRVATVGLDSRTKRAD